ncbi:MAG: hypothetical protein HY898_01495 [Deltaproteobacteria bacterium]|nr:hypothetical protein [Deltaproteobacteria bacterium]
MKHAAKWGFCVALAFGVAGVAVLATDDASAGKPKPAASAAPAAQVDPPNVKNQGGISISPQGLRFQMTPAELSAFYDNIIDDDFKELYKKAQPGPATTRLDSAVAEAKAAFRQSKVEFNNLPTGVDSTPLKGEYTYRNQEMMMKIARKGTTRYFFFVRGKLWKIYDEIGLRENGPLGKDFEEARKKYTDAFQVAGREIQPDYSIGRIYTEVDWQDPTTHLRLVDRSGLKVAGVVYEERATLNVIASYRTNKPQDTDTVDPDIAALVRPAGAPPVPSAPPPKKGKR